MASSMSASARFRILGQKGGRRHDLSRMAVAALGHIVVDPGLLHRMTAAGGKTLDGDDLLIQQRLRRA